MHGIVLVPGITGSQLFYKKESIWPPDCKDVPFGYRDIDELLDSVNVKVGSAIDFVVPEFKIGNIYYTTEFDLHTISNSVNGAAKGLCFTAPYDWRIDLFSALDSVSAQIENCAKKAHEITIICHSMGGLVVRLLLEWKYRDKATPAWFKKITRVLFVCTPHLGAPTALVKALGIEDSSTIHASDVKRLAHDSHFPSGYQLLPSATRNILWDTINNKYLPYDNPSVIAAFDFSKHNLSAAKKSSQALNWSKKPPAVEYTFVYGTGQPTFSSA